MVRETKKRTMKKLLVTADDLFLKLSVSPKHHVGEIESSFAIEVTFIEKGDILEGKLIVYNAEPLASSDSRTLLSFTGAMTVGEKEPVFFAGICESGEGYEECSLLITEPADIFESTTIGKQEFIALAKKYCASRDIAVSEDGNVVGEGFSLFENFVTDSNAPSPYLLVRENNMQIYTVLHNDYFPIIRDRKTVFGKFIAEKRVKIFSPEQLYLSGMEHLIA